MKVVHVTSSLVRKAAGVREVVLGLARAQIDCGMDVAVLGLDHPDWAMEMRDWDGIPTRLSSVLGPQRFGYAPQMTSVLKEMTPDVVHLHGLWMHPGRSVLNWHQQTGRPYIVSTHGMLSEVALSYSRAKKKFLSLWFQDAVLRNAAALHATNNNELAEIQAQGLQRPICVVPNGISHIARPDDIESSSRTILSLGRIHRIKALHHLVLAWRELERDFPEWSVLIVGPDEGGEVDRLQTLIKEAGIKRVTIRKPVYGEEKTHIMANASLFALPTLSENFAITVAESLMLEVPVIASHGAPWKRLVDQGCGLWVPIGPSHLADALRQMMLLSDEERRAMGARGRAWMLREFSWSSVVARLRSCYASACS